MNSIKNQTVGFQIITIWQGLCHALKNAAPAIRDPETAEIAVRAAQVGRLVLSTLHTNSAEGALRRLVDLGVPEFLGEARPRRLPGAKGSGGPL